MTEDKARAALRAFDAVGGLERWIVDQPWLSAGPRSGCAETACTNQSGCAASRCGAPRRA